MISEMSGQNRDFTSSGNDSSRSATAQHQHCTGMYFVAGRQDTYAYIDTFKVNLQGRYVLITGASKGVRRATATSYAKAGASGIAIAARFSLEGAVKDVREAAAGAGRSEPRILALEVDVTNRASVEAAAAVDSKAFDGRLDILINNAGYLSTFRGILDTDPDESWRDYEVNVRGVYLVTHAFMPMLIDSSLKILIIATSIGVVATAPGNSAYATSKVAVLRLTKNINQDNGEGKEGVLAIAVHPGGVMTELASKMPEALHEHLVGTPQLSGVTLVWLGAERREWLGGRYVSASWDMGALSEKKEEILKGDLLKMRLALEQFLLYYLTRFPSLGGILAL
jgi:NAD(P)-dependent dehydrogenase (short-subunit alcohol dehydrogenase family)